jgi:hypothetical protein
MSASIRNKLEGLENQLTFKPTNPIIIKCVENIEKCTIKGRDYVRALNESHVEFEAKMFHLASSLRCITVVMQ